MSDISAPQANRPDFLNQTMAARASLQFQMYRQENAETHERHQRIRNALGGSVQIEALRMMRAAEGRSYTPGIDFATTAYMEGRKAALDDLIQFLTQQEAN